MQNIEVAVFTSRHEWALDRSKAFVAGPRGKEQKNGTCACGKKAQNPTVKLSIKFLVEKTRSFISIAIEAVFFLRKN